MIQRIQSIYLFFASLVSGGLIFLVDIWQNTNQNIGVLELLRSKNVIQIIVAILFFVSAILSFYTIFKFKNRTLQVKLGKLNILINILLLSLLIYLWQTLSGETTVSKKDIGMLLPLCTFVLIVLANRAIKKDEALVKSADRIR